MGASIFASLLDRAFESAMLVEIADRSLWAICEGTV